MEARNRLRDLLTKMDGNDELEAQLMRIIGSGDQRAKLKAEVAAARPALTHAGGDNAAAGEAAAADGSAAEDKK
jgi:type VI secretion system protein ImpB